MKFPEALESRMYGNPERILEEKQAQAAREKQQDRRRVLHAKTGWSDARKRAESLFDFARGGAVSTVQTPALSASESLPGENPRKNLP